MIDDVRDLRGRLLRLALSALGGILGALAVTLILPTHQHFSGCMVGEGWFVTGGDPILILAGAVVIAWGLYPLFGAACRAMPAVRAPRLPRARARVRACRTRSGCASSSS